MNTICIQEDMFLSTNIAFATNIKKNTIYISKLVDDTNSSDEFTPSFVYVKYLQSKTTFAGGE